MSKSFEFIAEIPTINENELSMPWPVQEKYEKHARDMIAENGEEPADEDGWYFKNQVSGARNRYFRLRYRGQISPYYWRYCFSDQELIDIQDDPDGHIKQLIAHNLWAPATDAAINQYEATQDERYRAAAIFAGGLHAYDAVNEAWPMVDRRLSNDSGVRDKHVMGFIWRLKEVEDLTRQLDDTNSEHLHQKNYFESQYNYFKLFCAEIAAQNPLSFSSTLTLFDEGVGDTRRVSKIHIGRSSYLDFTNFDDERKIKVIERFKETAVDGYLRQDSKEFFAMEVLHLVGLVDAANFYDDKGYSKVKWWKLPVEEILTGSYVITSSTRINETSEPELAEQGRLF